MFSDILIRHDDQIIIAGQIGVLDMSNTTNMNTDRFNPTLVKKMTVLSQEASPIRHGTFHYINTPPGFDKILNVLKGFMSEKYQKKVRWKLECERFVFKTFFSSRYTFMEVIWNHFINLFQEDFYQKNMVVELGQSKLLWINGYKYLFQIEIL